MLKKKLALCDKEEEYITRLSEILESRSTFPFDVITYTDMEILKKDIKKGSIETLLISDHFLSEVDDICNNTLVVLLDTGININVDYPVIWKFQSGEAIRKGLMKAYSEYKNKMGEDDRDKSDDGFRSHKETIVIGVYTPIGRCLQTSFSILLGQLLSKNNSVLYLNFEAFSGLKKNLGYEDQKDITDLVYYMRGGANRLIYKMESLICKIGNLDFIPPASSFVDLCSVEEEDWLILIKTLKEQSDYEYIIMDLSSLVTGLYSVLRKCNVIYTITKPDSIALGKIEEYEQNLVAAEYEDILEKTKKKEIPIIKKYSNDLTKLEQTELSNFVKEVINGDLSNAV